MAGEGYVPAYALEVIQMEHKLITDDDRAWWELIAPEPTRCEVISKHEQCPEPAKYALTFRDKVGYICERDLISQIDGLTRYGSVTVEKLP